MEFTNPSYGLLDYTIVSGGLAPFYGYLPPLPIIPDEEFLGARRYFLAFDGVIKPESYTLPEARYLARLADLGQIVEILYQRKYLRYVFVNRRLLFQGNAAQDYVKRRLGLTRKI